MSGYEVDQHVQVEFWEGRDRDSLASRPGWLGIGHDEHGAIFGEVMNADIGVPSFTMRCYRVDEYLRLDQMRSEGLLLDAGSSRNMVVVPGSEIAKAISHLRKPLAALEVGEQVTILRNPEHPAWMEPALTSEVSPEVSSGDSESSYVLPEDFDPLISTGVQITDRQGDKVRAANSFWYRPDGAQDGSGATIAVSEHALDGTHLPAEIPRKQREQAAAVVVETQPPQAQSASSHRFDRSVVVLGEHIETLRGALGQWNPHNEKMRPRIREASRLLALAEKDVDHSTRMAERLPDLGLRDETEVGRRREGLAEYLEQASEDLSGRMERIGVPVSPSRGTPNSGHRMRLAAMKSAPSPFSQPSASREIELG